MCSCYTLENCLLTNLLLIWTAVSCLSYHQALTMLKAHRREAGVTIVVCMKSKEQVPDVFSFVPLCLKISENTLPFEVWLLYPPLILFSKRNTEHCFKRLPIHLCSSSLQGVEAEVISSALFQMAVHHQAFSCMGFWLVLGYQ